MSSLILQESWLKPGLRVGLLGGSFNPAHEGHLHISEIALKRLNLDRVVWLVSPQNPLKETASMRPFAERYQSAVDIAHNPAIIISDLEQRLQTSRTADTLSLLTARSPRTRLVWLMGADNLLQFHHWYHWERIAQTVPFAVISRPGYTHRLHSAKAAERLKSWKLDESDADILATQEPPAWLIIHDRLHPASSTAIRAGLG